MSKIVARDVAAAKAKPAPMRADKQATPGTQGTPGADSPAFFKTGPGIAVLAVMAVGAGFAIYSTQHDRIHSPAKQ
jgi:hypothetical protein